MFVVCHDHGAWNSMHEYHFARVRRVFSSVCESGGFDMCVFTRCSSPNSHLASPGCLFWIAGSDLTLSSMCNFFSSISLPHRRAPLFGRRQGPELKCAQRKLLNFSAAVCFNQRCCLPCSHVCAQNSCCQKNFLWVLGPMEGATATWKKCQRLERSYFCDILRDNISVLKRI